MLGEEDHLAHRAGELRRVVRRETRLCLTNLAHHSEHVFTRLSVLRLVELLLCHEAHEFASGAGGISRRHHAAIAIRQAATELGLCLANTGTKLVVKLHGKVDHALCGKILCHVNLATSHDPHRDNRSACLGVEVLVGRCQPRCLKLGHQCGRGYISLQPSQEPPNGTEVINVVNQRCSRERNAQGVSAGGALADALCESQHVL